MNEPRYLQVENTPEYDIFTFVSQGRHGDLVKIVSFNEIIGSDDVFNLALGTILPDGQMDFETITNNGDRNKVLATVASIVSIFIEHHPGKSVYIRGSDNRRTILYQRAILYAFDELILIFNIYGDISADSQENEFEYFNKGKNYSGFLIEKK